MRRGSFREKVRAAARELEKGEGFLYVALEDFLGVKTAKEQKSLQNAVYDLVKAGELQRPGRLRLSYVTPRPGAPSKQQIMWRFLRLKRRASKQQLRSVAEASERTFDDFAQAAQRQGLAEILPDGSLVLIGHPGEKCPFDEVRADRAKTWREKQKEILGRIDGIFADVADLRLAVSRLED